MKEFEWGPAVKLCLFFDRTGNYCKFCQAVTRAFHVYVLKRNPTFVGQNVPPEKM